MKNLITEKAEGLRIGVKPRSSTGLCGIFAVMMMLSGKAVLMIFGLIFALVTLIVVFFIQDRTCAWIYAEEIVLLPEETQAEVVIPFCEVAEWNIQQGIRIWTQSGQQYFVETWDTRKAYRALRRCMQESETIAIHQRQLRERKSRKHRRNSL